MERTGHTKVAIVGAGHGGHALLDLLHRVPSIEIVGIADRNPAAPGLQRARELRIPIIAEVPDLIGNHGASLIMDVTDDPEMETYLHAHRPPTTDILNGSSSRLVWELVQHEFKLEAELLQSEKLAGIGSFAAGIAHDINNPLQLILGLAENLAEERNLTAVHEQANEIIEAVKRTSAICRDLTRYSRRASPHEDVLVPVNGKLDEALRIARYASSFHDIEMIKQYQPSAAVTGNPDELLHVFVNLITNAVHAMEQAGGRLTIETSVLNGQVGVRISDTGCGIAPDKIPEIFEPFFTTKSPGKGTGLGLYNVKTIVDKMHGVIAVDSQIEKGTTFILTFPKGEPTGQEGLS
ncbi:MAG: GHKL domain-containing protein [Nitrospiraceae bacterium]|nr:GHKL domain-containing protein [Nitrospiraceae bacterium]